MAVTNEETGAVRHGPFVKEWGAVQLEIGRLWFVCRQSISDSWLGNLREYLAHLV
jgi:hypothetical protein